MIIQIGISPIAIVAMSTLNQLLSDLDATQESIGRASRAMLSIQNEEDAVPIAVREWSAELRAGDSDQALPFIYLANDVLQVGVRARIQCPSFVFRSVTSVCVGTRRFSRATCFPLGSVSHPPLCAVRL